VAGLEHEVQRITAAKTGVDDIYSKVISSYLTKKCPGEIGSFPVAFYGNIDGQGINNN